jgi:hypothetical protein
MLEKRYCLFFSNSFLNHKKLHGFFFCFSLGFKSAITASSKTSFKPFWVKAEHSQYFSALKSFANLFPCSVVIGFCLLLPNVSNVAKSSRKSTCVPTIT